MTKETQSAGTRSSQAADETAHAVRQYAAEFTKATPHTIYGARVHEFRADEVDSQQKRPVPDGAYRILGTDFIYHFKGGRCRSVSLGGPNSKPSDYNEIAAAGG